MSKIKCLVVDDESIAQRIMVNYLNELDNYEVVATCNNAIKANQVLNQQAIDLMFLDIEMPKIKGLAFLKTLAHPPAVIITTAHREFALEGFELDVIDYLLKPISFERFLKALNKFNRKHAASLPVTSPLPAPPTPPEKIIYLKSDRKMLRLKENQIRYIEGMSNYVVVHVQDQKHAVYISLTEIKSKLSANFIRVHKSYIVNKQFVNAYTKEIVDIAGEAIPIGKSFREGIQGF